MEVLGAASATPDWSPGRAWRETSRPKSDPKPVRRTRITSIGINIAELNDAMGVGAKL